MHINGQFGAFFLDPLQWPLSRARSLFSSTRIHSNINNGRNKQLNQMGVVVFIVIFVDCCFGFMDVGYDTSQLF